MHKINTDTATSGGEFTDGDEGQAIPPTELNASWFNAVQRELCNIVTGLGSALSDSNDSQILQALKLIGIVSEVSSTDVSSASPIDSKVIIHSAENFAITGTLSLGSILIVVPMWNAGSPDSISISYGDSPIVIRKWNAYIGIVTNAGEFFAIGYPLLMPGWDGSVTVPKITAPKVIDPNLVDFVNEDAGEGEPLAPWQEWQLKSNWELNQVKKVRCTNVGEGGDPIIVYHNTNGGYRNVTFYPHSYREFICVGEYDNGVHKFAVLMINGKN